VTDCWMRRSSCWRVARMPELAELHQRASAARSHLERRKGERDALLARRQEVEQQLASARMRSEHIGLAAILLREAGDFAREQVRQRVQDLVTSSLQAVFGPGYEFHLEAGKIGNRAAVWCRIRSPYGGEGVIETEGIDSRGGGIADIQAIALRWAMLETARPAIEGPLLLDEPCKHVSADNLAAAGAFLQQACRQFGRQVIMVTHLEHLAELADQVVRVELRDGASHIT